MADIIAKAREIEREKIIALVKTFRRKCYSDYGEGYQTAVADIIEAILAIEVLGDEEEEGH